MTHFNQKSYAHGEVTSFTVEEHWLGIGYYIETLAGVMRNLLGHALGMISVAAMPILPLFNASMSCLIVLQ